MIAHRPGFNPAFPQRSHAATPQRHGRTSNRLATIAQGPGGTRAYAYDATGNVVSDSRGAGYAYTYDAAGRMATMSINGVLQGSYKYDFAGRQVIRTLTSPTAVTIHSVFDSDGRRIAEYNEGTGALIREYVWMGWGEARPDGLPVEARQRRTPANPFAGRGRIAVIEGGVVSFVRTDHIGRPVFATNTAGVKVWTASYTSFGGVRTTTGTPINARFPGQWFQSESGLHQNWMRDYDPTTGRYLQADPLGLVDGASVYGYAGQSPGRLIDPRGEEYKPGKTPPSRGWPPPPESLCGKKPKWNPIGYWEGKGGKKISWDDRSHGSGIDRGKGPQGGHWDDGSGSGGRWDPDGMPLPFSPMPTDLEACDICAEALATPPIPPETGMWTAFGVAAAYIGYSLLCGAASTF